MLNHSRLSTAEEVAQEFEDYSDATVEFLVKGLPGFIAPVDKGFAMANRLFGSPVLVSTRVHEEHRSQDPLQRNIRELSNTLDERARSQPAQGQEKTSRKRVNHNQDQAGSPNEDSAR